MCECSACMGTEVCLNCMVCRVCVSVVNWPGRPVCVRYLGCVEEKGEGLCETIPILADITELL